MRVLLFANNWVGWQVANLLQSYGETIVGLVLHPATRRQRGKEITQSAGVNEAHVFDGSQLHTPAVQSAIAALQPDIGVSALFGYILKPALLELLPQGCINLHPSFLPYNRGAYPNVWSIIEGTPAGVTIHSIDQGIDTGPIIAQRAVAVASTDTGQSLYHKLEQAAVELFAETWPLLRSGSAPRLVQALGEGSYHRTSDVAAIDEIDLDRTYSGRELINLLRARTFPPHPGAFFRDGDRKIYLELRLHDKEQP